MPATFLLPKWLASRFAALARQVLKNTDFFSGENTMNNIMLGSPKRARPIRAGTVQGTASAGRRMVPACLTQPSSSGTSGYSFISYFNVIRVIARYCQVLQSTIEYSQVLSGTDWQVVSGGVRY